MRKVLLAFLILAAAYPCLAKYSGGTGTKSTPYQIANVADLMTLANDANDYNKCFIMTADIDLDPNISGNQIFTTAVIASDTNGSNFTFDGIPFIGTFDGAGHKISNLTITQGVKNDYLGLFGDVNSSEIKNLKLENVSINGGSDSYYPGGLVGYKDGGSISNCYSIGVVTGGLNSRYLGGLVGGNNSGSINDCYFEGNVTGSFYYGGLVGKNNGNIVNCFSSGNIIGLSTSDGLGGLVGNNFGSIDNCYSTAVLSGDMSGGSGGLVGNNYGDINDCHSTGNVISGNNNYSETFGGLAGHNTGRINNCYSTGIVASGDNSHDLGGLVGHNGGSISNCYSTGSATEGNASSYFGGLVGYNQHGTISGCYSTGAVTAGDDPYRFGGLVGYNDGNISDCYATGPVSGGIYSYNLGGLVGSNFGGIRNCYSTGTITRGRYSQYIGGLVGENGSSIGSSYFLNTSGPSNGYGTPRTDAQMKQQASFVGWDFVWETVNGPNDVWAICEGVSYPKLAWQFIPGDSDNDKDVDFTDFALLGNKWRQTDSNLYCGGTDLTGDGIVDIYDLAVFANNWLQ